MSVLARGWRGFPATIPTNSVGVDWPPAGAPDWWETGDGAYVPAMKQFMEAAIAEAEAGLAEGGIPIGAVLVHDGVIIGRGHNQRMQVGSAILHGEMAALEQAGRQPAAVYRASTMYTTLSPCAMCTGAMLLYGIPRVVIGEHETFLGEEELLRARGVTVEVLHDPRCVALMAEFIAAHPEAWAEDIGETPPSA